MPRSASAAAPGERPTFLLGAGAQKAGTTWLYQHLKRAPGFAAGFRKEYHVLDVMDVPEQTYMRNRVVDLAQEELERLRRGEPADADVIRRMAMTADLGLYIDYFSSLLHGSGATLTADMTPENALVPADRLREVQTGFAQRGVRTVGLLLMRDPVERVWSQIRMQHYRNPGRFNETPEETLLRGHPEWQYDARTRYEEILPRLEAALPQEDLIISFYERLFDHDELERICGRLGVVSPEPRLRRRANTSPVGGPGPTPEVVARVSRHFAETYRFVQSRLDVDLADLWPSSRHVL